MKRHILALGLMLLAAPAAAQSQLPADLQAAIRAQGPVLGNTPEVNRQLRLLHVDDPAPRGVAALRDIAYGAHPLQKLDVFWARPEGGGRGGRGGADAAPAAAAAPPQPKPVVIFIHGGEMQGGDKHGVGAMDNTMVWLVNNGYVGVSMNYRLVPDAQYPTANEDIAGAITWVRKNAAQYGGNPDKVVLWGHSSGANLVGDYVSHPQFHPPGPPLAAAAIFSGARSFDLTTYGTGGGAYYTDDKSKYAERSTLAGLIKTNVPLFIEYAEFDPPNISTANEMVNKAMCAAKKCPAVFLKSAVHNHFSQIDTFGTADKQISEPFLAFLKKYAQ
jgi:acetyl esterase/lipase